MIELHKTLWDDDRLRLLLPESTKETRNKLIHTAIYRHNLSALQMLVMAGIDLEFKDRTGYTPLLSSCIIGTDRISQYLIEAGADVNATNKRGGTALEFAIDCMGLKTIEMLLKAGCRVTEKTIKKFNRIMGDKFNKSLELMGLMGRNHRGGLQ